jgi:hypothetical protein
MSTALGRVGRWLLLLTGFVLAVGFGKVWQYSLVARFGGTLGFDGASLIGIASYALFLIGCRALWRRAKDRRRA